MARMKLFIVVLISLILLLSLFSCSSKNIEIGENDNGKTINCSTGQKIIITLDSNPSTGYSWYISGNSKTSNLELISQDFKQKEAQKLGAGGKQLFTFKAIQKGEATLILEYKREWEKDTPPEKTFEVDFKIN